jgi:peptidoglycan/xylan/chitin deacetylase (PgdA/CDA1 family)
VLAAVVACHYDVDQADNAFYGGGDRRVHCAIDIDTYTRVDLPSIETGLDRARDRGEVLELYAHRPGDTIGWDKVESVLAGAQSRGLAFVTYGDFASGTVPGVGTTGGLALSFDDAYVADWFSGRALFQQYGARLTFFIAFYDQFSATYKDELHQLASDGHDIEAHSVKHLRGPVYVEALGLGTYMSDEVVPSIDHLRDDGYDVTTFAYPYGARTSETDRAILSHVTTLRSVTYTWDSPATDPCPL